MEEVTCEICKVRPAMKHDILCGQCSDKYVTLLKSATNRTRQINARSSEYAGTVLTNIEPKIESGKQVTQTVLESPLLEQQSARELLENQQLVQPRVETRQKLSSERIGVVFLGIGLLALGLSVVFTSTILTFIGLGMAFWGMLAFFVRPQSYVRSDLMNATALSSLKTIDKVITEGIGYRERAVYIPSSGPEKAVAFIPSEPFSMIPQSTAIEGKTRLNDPQGLLVVPPGLALSNLIETKLGFDLRNCGLETLVRNLPKVLVEDLEIVRDVEIEVKGDLVKFKLVDSIYADFCKQVLDSGRRCGLGCPMCSALACVLTIATGKPVLSQEEKSAPEGGTTESCYQLLSGPRL